MKSGKIYFLRRSDSLIKVGFTSNFKRRLEALTHSHGPLEILRVVNGDKAREKRLHNALGRFNEFGEWFRDCAEVRELIAAQSDGSLIALAADEIERSWLRGEQRLAEDARRIVLRMVESRRQRAGCKNEKALDLIAKDYGISKWMLRNIHSGRATQVSAYAMEVLRAALPTELLKHRDELLADIALVQSGGALVAKLETAKSEAARARK